MAAAGLLSQRPKWDFPGAFYFVATVVSTIGGWFIFLNFLKINKIFFRLWHDDPSHASWQGCCGRVRIHGLRRMHTHVQSVPRTHRHRFRRHFKGVS
jgi:hypothetical protein